MDEMSTCIPTCQIKNNVFDLLEFALDPPPKGRPNANSGKPCQWYKLWMRSRTLTITWLQPLVVCVKWPSDPHRDSNSSQIHNVLSQINVCRPFTP